MTDSVDGFMILIEYEYECESKYEGMKTNLEAQLPQAVIMRLNLNTAHLFALLDNAGVTNFLGVRA